MTAKSSNGKVEIGESEGRGNHETSNIGVSQIFSGNLNNLGIIAIFKNNPVFLGNRDL